LWHKADITTVPNDVCFWHKADIVVALCNVRFWGDSGHVGLNYQILLNRLRLPQKVGRLRDIRRDIRRASCCGVGHSVKV
jgi:hypothetical protein